MTLRRRTYPEVLENLLTGMTGSVAAESHPFPPPGSAGPPHTSPLQQPPATALVSVWGARDGRPHAFRTGVDVVLAEDGGAIVWPAEGAEYPDPGTLVQVSYRPEGAQSALTDVNVGSVARTLLETTALEMARLYAMLEAVYDAAFVDTATGSSLDNVVALLGIERVRGGLPTGEVELTRAPGSPGEITVPAGTRVATADGRVEYETTATATMSPAQAAIRIAVRDLEPNDPLPADSLTLLPKPIAGIAGARNPAPTSIAAQDETDAELRTRAKSFLHGSERATRGALEHAIRGEGITADIDESQPGHVVVTPHADVVPPDLQQRLLSALDAARPAGVETRLAAHEPPYRVDLRLLLTSSTGLLELDLRAAQRAVRDLIADYFARLPARSDASVNQIVGLVLGVAGIEDVQIVEATWTAPGGAPEPLDPGSGRLAIAGHPTVLGELHIADPNLPTVMDVVVSHPAGAPPDTAAIAARLGEALAALNSAGEAAAPLPFGLLLAATPLPGHDAVPISPPPAALPDEGDVLPYVVRYVLRLESGLTTILAGAGDVYAPTAFERLALGEVQAAEHAGG
jgi:hypothetical protein